MSSGTSQPPMLSCGLCLPGELPGTRNWPEQPQPMGLSNTKLHPQTWQLELCRIPSLRSQVIWGCSSSGDAHPQANEFWGQEEPPDTAWTPPEPQLLLLRDPKAALPTPARQVGAKQAPYGCFPCGSDAPAARRRVMLTLQLSGDPSRGRSHDWDHGVTCPGMRVSGQHPWAPRERHRAGRKR